MTVRSWKNPGVGFARHRGAQQRIIIGLDPETFMQVRRRAKAAGTSFAEQVRVLVELVWKRPGRMMKRPNVGGLASDDKGSDDFSEISDLS